MVGVCLTVIGLIRVVITLGRADTLADDFLAVDALLFLVTCLLSYWALRSRSLRRMQGSLLTLIVRWRFTAIL